MTDDLRPARLEDIESVLARLSDQNRLEYEKIGYPGEAFMARLFEFMYRGDTVCLWFDGKPQAILAIKPGEPLPCTWLVCSKEFFQAGSITTRIARRYMKGAVERYGKILTITGSERPNTAKWMRLLGATQIKENIFLFSP